MNFGLREHFATLFRHWGKVVLIVFFAVLVTGSVAFLSSKVYVAEARVLILNRSPADQVTQRGFDGSAGVSSPQEQVLTQVAIAESPLLAERLALAIGPERVLEEMTWRWDWLRELPSKLKDNAILALAAWGPTAPLIEMIGIKLPEAGGGGPPVAAARDKLADAFGIEAIVKTDMFVIGMQAPSPEFSAEAVNTLMDIYVEHVAYLSRNNRTAELARVEAERLREELSEAEEALQTFAVEHDILSIERQKNLLLDRLFRLEEELDRAERDRLEVDQKQETILARLATQPKDEAVSVTTRPNPLVDSLRDRLAALQAEAVGFVPGSPAASRIRREIEGIQTQIQSAAEAVAGNQTTSASEVYRQLQATLALQDAERRALDVRREFVSRQLGATRTELTRLDGHETRYRSLQRTVDNKEQAFNYAMQKREETALSDQISQSNFAVVVPVEPATPPELPSSPRRMLLLALGVIVGLMGGVATAYLLEFARSTMSTRREVELALGHKVLASQWRRGLLSRKAPQNKLEMRRFAALMLRERGARERLGLMLASARPRAGRTEIATELAASLHRQGASVLRIAINLTEGGSKARTALADSADRAIPEDAEPRDGILSDNATITGPAWAIRDAVDALLETHGERYGFVLIDPPAFESFPEQLHLAGLTDFVLPVVEAERSRTAEVLALIRQFEEARRPVLGLVLNKQRYRTASWAFSWMSMTRRKAFERAA